MRLDPGVKGIGQREQQPERDQPPDDKAFPQVDLQHNLAFSEG
jgi:hypothetical protein